MDTLVPFDLGAVLIGGACRFRVWAPRAQFVTLRLLGDSDDLMAESQEHRAPMALKERGYHEAVVEGVRAGQRYVYRLEEGPDRPDPASRWQPEGVHAPSVVVDLSFPWTDQGWAGLAPRDYVIYEVHIGAFTPEGTFDAAVGQLDRLAELGVTAVEVMPVAAYPGARNWGYDGVSPFAVHHAYGGPRGLQRFVDACHARGLACLLDVVYNHLGPEGNYLRDFGPYFTNRYTNPWGDALNFDGAGSDEVRRFFLANALQWQRDFHLDGLRLDAVDTIKDGTARHFLAELADATAEMSRATGRPFHLIAETDQNDARLLLPRDGGGYGLGGQWADDFHHATHALLTGERTGYYADFATVEHLARAYRRGYAYTGQFSTYRQRRHGGSSSGLDAHQFVWCIQNHDQVGNRARGDRLSTLVDFESLKLAAGLLLLSPFTPMLFMGEEYGEEAPFAYFTSHEDGHLVEAVRRGRTAEFAAFAWQGPVPDPQAEETFLRCKLRPGLATEGKHRTLHDLYRELLRLRREACVPPARGMGDAGEDAFDVRVLPGDVLEVRRSPRTRDGESLPPLVLLYSLPGEDGSPEAEWAHPGRWRKLIDSAESRWAGPGERLPDLADGPFRLEMPRSSFALYRREA